MPRRVPQTKFKPTERNVRKILKEIRDSIGITLDRRLNDICNEAERERARQAYINLSFLHNSLHRYLLKKQA